MGQCPLATIYELAGYANAPVERVPVFGAPKTGLTPEGEWDDFVMPLLDGSGVITQFLEQSVYVNKFVFSSSPIYFDNLAFITAHPTRLRFTSLARLAGPLRPSIWVAIGLSCVFVFTVLQATIQLHMKLKLKRRERWKAAPEHRWHFTAAALASPALDQFATFSR